MSFRRFEKICRVLSRSNVAAFGVVAMAFIAPAAAFNEPEGGPPATAQREEAPRQILSVESETSTWLLPPGDVYPRYAADVHRTGFAVRRMFYSKSSIPASGTDRVEVKAGSLIGIVRRHAASQPGYGWQVSAGGGVSAQFDMEHRVDNIGWDGTYGLIVTSAQPAGLSFKAGILHTSSHVGDEYAERTGRKSLNYTREELVWGVCGAIGGNWRVYTEGGYAYHMGNDDLQKPGRIQAGMEYERPRSPLESEFGWYGAVDASSRQERDWHLEGTVQIGFLYRSVGRVCRLGLEHHYGRPTLSEFFQLTEQYTAVGLWMDL